MKKILLAALCLSPLLALAEQGPAALETLDVTGDLSGKGCMASCETTLTACKQQCRDTRARAHDEHFDESDVSLAACIADCESEASICREDC
jgi:hypothetical protein